jgi:hypothetical protein
VLQQTEMDARVSLVDQLSQEVGPVILINTFTVAPEDVDQLLQAEPPTRRTSRPSLGSSPPSCTAASPAAACSSTTPFGNPSPPSETPSPPLPTKLRELSRLEGGLAAPVPEGRGARHLRRPLENARNVSPSPAA